MFTRKLQNKIQIASFTLLEVLVTMFIVALCFVAIFNAQSVAIALFGSSKNLSTAAILAQSQMAKLELSFKSKDWGEIPEEQEGDFSLSNFPEFAWKAAFTEDEEIKRLSELFGGGTDIIPDETLKQAASFAGINPKIIGETLNQNIRRLTLTVSWDVGFDKGSITVYNHFLSKQLKGLSGIFQVPAKGKDEK